MRSLHTRASGGAAARDRGVAAVEFALVAPLLIALALGTIEFGQRFNDEAGYDNAAAAAARSYALGNNPITATAAARNAGLPPSVSPSYSFKFDSGLPALGCLPGLDGSYPNVTVSIVQGGVVNATLLGSLLPGLGTTHTISGSAVARCAV